MQLSVGTFYYESRGTLATQNINFKVCVTSFEDLRKTIAGNNTFEDYWQTFKFMFPVAKVPRDS